MEAKTIGSFIAVLRKANGLTQKQLAEKLCVSDKTVSRWERDETTPDLSLIPVIAEIFGVTSDELLRGKRRQTSPTTPTAETPGEKQVQRLLSGTRTKHTTRMILSAAIALLGWVITIPLTLSYQRYAAIAVALAGALVAIVFQIISSVNLFTSVHSEEFDSPRVTDLKRHILSSTGLVTGAIAALSGCIVPYLYEKDYSRYDAIVSGAIWGCVTLFVWLGLYLLIKYFITEHGHEYLKD